MQLYKNKPEDFKLFRKQVLSRSIPITVSAIAAGLVISYYSQGEKTEGWEAVLIYMGIIAAVVTYGIFKSVQRQQEMFNSYELTVASDHFLRKQAGLADNKIFFADVDTIKEGKNGYLGINGPGIGNQIFISPYVENYDELKSILQSLKPIAMQNNKSLLQKYPYVPLAAVLALMGALYISQNKIVVAVSSVLLTTLLLWSFYKIRTSTLIDSRIKRTAWWGLVVLVSIVLITYYKIFGFGGLEQ